MEEHEIVEEFKDKPKIPRTPDPNAYEKGFGNQSEREANIINEQDYFSLSNNKGGIIRQSFNEGKINISYAKDEDKPDHSNKKPENEKVK